MEFRFGVNDSGVREKDRERKIKREREREGLFQFQVRRVLERTAIPYHSKYHHLCVRESESE